MGELTWRLLAGGALLYLALLGALFGGQRRLIYLPDTVTPDPAQAGVPEMRPVRLSTGDGLSLLAWYRPALDPEGATLVYFHGNAGHIGMRGAKVKPYLEAGYGVLLPSFRGYSGNPGRPSEEGLYRDARAALDYLEAAGVEAERIVLYGESLGSGVAVEMAARKPAAALVLEAPFTSIPDVAAYRFPFMPVRYLVHDRFDSQAKIARVSAPVLIVHGERDATVPARFGRKLFAAASEPKEIRLIPKGGHNDLYDHGMAEIVLDFLARRLARGEREGEKTSRP